MMNPDTRLVTLTVGGADLGFRDVLTRCALVHEGLPGEDDCKEAIATEVTPNLPKLGDNLTSLYADIAAAAPEARIVVTGYPLLFREVEVPVSGGFSPELVINPVNNAGDALNKTIEEAVATRQMRMATLTTLT
jgi:hypothetical protein